MLFPGITHLAAWALLLLRLALAAVFAASGWSHVRRPVERGRSIGMSPAFTLGLGVVELIGAASITLGVYAQAGAILLGAVMLGAIEKKIVEWKTGFFGPDGKGWYYDLLYLIGNLVVLATGGGRLVLT